MISVVEVRASVMGGGRVPFCRIASARTLRFSVAFLLLAVAVASPGVGQSADSGGYRNAISQIQQMIEAGKLGEARNLITTASARYPHDGGLENLLGVVEIEQGHTTVAENAFSKAIAYSPGLASAYLNLSRIKMSSAATDRAARAEALRLSLKALQLDPASDEARYQAATIYFWDKDYRVSLDQVRKLSPHARVKIGAQALVCADTAVTGDRQAVDKASEALAANPDLTEDDADTCVALLRTARRADLIAQLLAAAAEHKPLSAQGARTLGLALEAEDKLSEALTALESAFATQPTSVEILQDLARVAREAKDDQRALGYLAHARDLQPGNAALAYEFGAVCVHMGLLAEARKAIGEALRLEPDNPEYNLGMGTVVSFSDDPSQSMPYLNKYRALRPEDPQGILALGTASYRAKDYESAAKWLAEAVRDKQTAAEALFYLGRIARQEGRLDQATADLKRSLALRPDQPDVLAELGQISTQKSDFAQASGYFDQALRKDPDNYGANFGLLQLYARTGDTRRDQQSRRFDEIKNMKEAQDKQMMRMIEIRPNGSTAAPKQLP